MIPQISSLFTLVCGQKMVWQWTGIIRTFKARKLADTNYRYVSHKNRGGQQFLWTDITYNPNRYLLKVD